MKYSLSSKIFGELEAEIMEVVWSLKRATVRDVLNILYTRRKKRLAYNTVMTVMSRLYAKGILKRRLDRRGAYIYSPKKEKKRFLELVFKKFMKDLIDEFGDVAVSQFIDAIQESGREERREWMKKLKKIH